MGIQLKEIIKDEMERLEKEISSDKFQLEQLCEKRQKVGALKNAYSKYGIQVMDVENNLKDINFNISEFSMNIETKNKELFALQEYFSELEDSEICENEIRIIEENFPVIRIS